MFIAKLTAIIALASQYTQGQLLLHLNISTPQQIPHPNPFLINHISSTTKLKNLECSFLQNPQSKKWKYHRCNIKHMSCYRKPRNLITISTNKQPYIFQINQTTKPRNLTTIPTKTTQTKGAFTDISLDNTKSRHYETTMALICQSFHRLFPLLPCGKPKFQNVLSLTFQINDFFFF